MGVVMMRASSADVVASSLHKSSEVGERGGDIAVAPMGHLSSGGFAIS
jgi:hypothetical protein